MAQCKNKRVSQVLLISVFLLLINGCAALIATPESEKKAVEQRITELAQAKINGDWAKVYQYYDSGYKAQISEKKFTRGGKFIFESFTIENLTVAQDLKSATALVKYDAIVNGYDLSGMPEKQLWIKEKGDWVLKVNPHQSMID